MENYLVELPAVKVHIWYSEDNINCQRKTKRQSVGHAALQFSNIYVSLMPKNRQVAKESIVTPGPAKFAESFADESSKKGCPQETFDFYYLDTNKMQCKIKEYKDKFEAHLTPRLESKCASEAELTSGAKERKTINEGNYWAYANLTEGGHTTVTDAISTVKQTAHDVDCRTAETNLRWCLMRPFWYSDDIHNCVSIIWELLMVGMEEAIANNLKLQVSSKESTAGCCFGTLHASVSSADDAVHGYKYSSKQMFGSIVVNPDSFASVMDKLVEKINDPRKARKLTHEQREKWFNDEQQKKVLLCYDRTQ